MNSRRNVLPRLCSSKNVVKSQNICACFFVFSAKERERKERQEQHKKDLQQDLQAWQQELRDFQDIVSL